ncbi:hypothetical protein PHLGIDRAFT_124784 [Phlebiopsis gigantea 11061_1 CR5-6]|uniref:ditrans,polycis-polyprenyl diphosphate synthase [(2E,6E)-farnesyldiphosphate specific] n=1 Tax=Phlebiopsis gigantea (strain 11061_1 CR5-6) TaxID=745531 RepID=A0A0C3SF30_PHLG1|nr:hypothetical protein PHLGIDRAFT_124784 [Phlebiopsis gigantea 11061_1 CR5-6]
MSWLASFILSLFHAVYYVFNAVSTFRASLARPPNPLAAKRKQVPTHLALLLNNNSAAVDEAFECQLLDNVQEAISWCRAAGVQQLTVYDREGILYKSSYELRSRIYNATEGNDTREVEAEVQYPLTPPPSDDSSSSSRSLSPEYSTQPKLHVTTVSVSPKTRTRQTNENEGVKRRKTDVGSMSPERPFTLHIASRNSGKPAVAELATSLKHSRPVSQNGKSTLSIADIQSVLEGEHGLPPPDLMIIHRTTEHTYPKHVLELYGFPPWQLSLTEFYYTVYPTSWNASWSSASQKPHSYIPISEIDICRALDQFSGAEMRLGK